MATLGSPLCEVYLNKPHPEDAPIVINAAIGLQDNVETDKLRQILVDKFITIPRFSSVLVKKGSRLRWQPVEVDLNQHLREEDLIISLDGSVNLQQQVLERVNQMMTEPLHPGLPQWEIVILRHPPLDSCACTIVGRIHHSIGDGMSLSSLFLDACTSLDGGPVQQWVPRMSTGGGRKKVLDMIRNTAVSSSKSMKLLLGRPDRAVGVKAPNSVRHLPREAALLSLELEDVRSIAKKLGVTINDIILVLMSATINRLAARDSADVSNSQGAAPGRHSASKHLTHPRTMVLVNLRPPLSAKELDGMRADGEVKRSHNKWGNAFGFFVADLPNFEVSDVKEMVKCISERTVEYKNSWEAYLVYQAFFTLQAIGGSKWLARFLTDLSCKTTLPLSNLVGPQDPIRLAGSQVSFMYYFNSGTPTSAVVHVLSYASTLSVAVTSCPEIVRARDIVDCMAETFFELKKEF